MRRRSRFACLACRRSGRASRAICACGGCDCQRVRAPAIYLGVRRPVCPCCLHMLYLDRRGSRVPSAHCCPLHGTRIVSNAVRPSVKCHVPLVHDGVVANDRFIHVGIVDDVCINPHDRGVVGESVAAPLAACKADTHVTKSVIDSAVIPDTITPVAIVKSIMPSIPTPPWRRPESALIGSRHPLARNPVIAIVAVGPISRRPHPAFLRTWRLLVHRQDRRSNVDGNQYARERCRGNKQHH